MLDLETLGTKPDAPIIQVGLVAFDDAVIHHGWGWNPKPSPYEGPADRPTIEWWINQVKRGNHFPEPHAISFRETLEQIQDIMVGDAKEVWAWSPSFDCVMLNREFRAHGITAPWTYRMERDCRTLQALVIEKDIETSTVAAMGTVRHEALSDAMAQAEWTIKALNRLKGKS